MNILKTIKSWWKPEVKEESESSDVVLENPTIRIRNGNVFSVTMPKSAQDPCTRMHVSQICDLNRSHEAELLARQRAVGMMNIGIGGQNIAAQSSERFRNNLL